MVDVLDVAELQGAVQWGSVASSGVGAVWVRACEGTTPDRLFRANWQAAREAGLPRGAYTYLRARHDAAPLADALLEQLGDDLGELPLMLDLETLDGRPPGAVLACLVELTERVTQATGRPPVLYTGPSFWRVRMWPAASDAGWTPPPLWVADYRAGSPEVPPPWTDWALHQYTDRGCCQGIAGFVDRSRWRGTLDELVALGQPLVDTPTEPRP